MLSACSKSEEDIWRLTLRARITAENRDCSEGRTPANALFSGLPPDLRSIGPAFGHPESLARCVSIQRAATLGPGRVVTRQVVIKHTHTQQRACESHQSDGMPMRSQTHSPSAHVPTLTPRRADRVRLETMLSDVWTKDLIPYPGMLARRAEHPIRSSASSMMRKLSMASLASNFSKRSASVAATNRSTARTSAASREENVSQASIRSRRTQPDNGWPTWPRKVDFQTAPDAFLPHDFELPEQGPRRPWKANDTLRQCSGSNCSTEPQRQTTGTRRPFSPAARSNASTPCTQREVKAEPMSLDADTAGRLGTTANNDVPSPKRERNRLTKPRKCSDVARPSAQSPSACEGTNEPKRWSNEIDQHQPASTPLKDCQDPSQPAKKAGKVKSKLLRLWTT